MKEINRIDRINRLISFNRIYRIKKDNGITKTAFSKNTKNNSIVFISIS